MQKRQISAIQSQALLLGAKKERKRYGKTKHSSRDNDRGPGREKSSIDNAGGKISAIKSPLEEGAKKTN